MIFKKILSHAKVQSSFPLFIWQKFILDLNISIKSKTVAHVLLKFSAEIYVTHYKTGWL